MRSDENTKLSCTLEDVMAYLDENEIVNNLVEKEFDGEKFRYVIFNFPVARTHEEITLSERDDLYSIIHSDFVKYRGISNYEAIWSSELKCIECEIQGPTSLLSPRYVLKRLASVLGTDEEFEDDRHLSFPSEVLLFEDSNIKISLGFGSNEFNFLSCYKEGRHIDFNANNGRYRTTLKIENIELKTEEDARNLLEKISNSLFYQIDVLYDLPITLTPKRISIKERMRRRRRDTKNDYGKTNLTLDYEYDKIPMAFYWFAQNNTNSPIFMYFALYQVLEYYFPIYSTIEVKTRMQNLMKDPRFNINKDEDVVRLLNIMNTNSAKSVGDESEQLNNVLRHIVSGEEIINFIEEKDYLKDYYTEKISNKLSEKKLRLSDKLGIVSDVSSRIYDIRCRIVHNKASETNKKILPITKEADYLRFETELLKFVSQKAIISNSSHMLLK